MRGPPIQTIDLAHLHGGDNRHLHSGLGDAEVGQHGTLSFGGRTPVAPHCWDDERLPSAGAHFTPNGGQDARNVGDTTAACGEPHTHAWMDTAIQGTALLGYSCLKVLKHWHVEMLPHAVHRRQRCRVLQPAYLLFK